jgi:hypothetical protein
LFTVLHYEIDFPNSWIAMHIFKPPFFKNRIA